ncbi:MAG: response regulator [Cytophagaceae bacterium]|nr:response regulator [Cytophagaceae bacterium]
MTHSILIADDDADDRYLLKSAFEDCQLSNPLYFVEDGAELIDYLLHQGFYHASAHLLPDLILLDLNMPRKDGREALREIKEHPKLKSIPVIILTTSKLDHDIIETYSSGANCFITKPSSFEDLLDVVQSLNQFWLQTARIPLH